MKKSPAPPVPARQEKLLEAVELLHQMFQAVDVFSRQTLRDFGVTSPQIWALRTISDADVVSMGELAQRMHLHMSTVSGIIDRLEATKLVTRERSVSDARVMEVRLTPRGRTILPRVPEPPRSKAAKALARLNARDLEKVHASLLLIARAMDVRLDPPDGE